MCNAFLQEGILPLSERHAIVTPRLNKPGSDAWDVKNYRSISNLSFMSKIVEKLIYQQLVHFLEKHNLLPKCQSAYRRYHSTETAVLKIVSDAVSAAEKGESMLLGMLDMSAAFDTVDHDKRLHMSFGIRGAALSWISSFVRQRTQTVAVNGKMSETSLVTCGVPRAVSSVQFCSCSTRRTWHASSRCMASTSTHMPTTLNYIFTTRRTKLL